jgi:phosphate transport system substrate-binding protein
MRFFVIFFLMLFSVACSQEVVPPGEPSGFVQVKGSDTIVNVAQMLSEEFMKKYPYVYVAVTGGGSGVGIASLLNKTCDIATSSREIKPKEIEMAHKVGVDPKEHIVAFDGVAVIVNKDNPVSKLTIKQMHDIYTGKVTNWKEFSGVDMSIVVISREVSSGTHVYFKEEVVQLGDKKNKEEFASSVLLMSSSQAIVEEVAQNKSAIGYLGMGYAGEKTKTLLLSKDGGEYYVASIDNVLSKKYPLARSLLFYTNGTVYGNSKLFIDFVFSPDGQKQFVDAGFVPLRKYEDSAN